MIHRSVRGTLVAIPCNRSDRLSNILLIILPSQVGANNKHVREKIVQRQQRDKGNTKEKSLKLSLVNFFLYIYTKTLHTAEKGFDVFSPRE